MTRNNSKEYEVFELKNVTTGQVVNTSIVEVSPGTQISTKITTEGQRESYKAHEDSVEGMRECHDNENQKWFHLIYKYYDAIFKELQEKIPGNKANIHIIRFIILATYSNYKGELAYSNGQRIDEGSLKKIWDIKKKATIDETYNLLKECGYVYETAEGYLMINEEMVIKGEIKDYYKELKKQDSNYTYVRIYINAIREMYYGTTAGQRKQLANLFKILPYVNYKYNVFCSNPEETDPSKIEPLSWTALADMCGYENNKHISDFIGNLKKLKINGQFSIGQFQRGTEKKRIIVNPSIYYAGINKDDIKGIEDYFKI